MNTKRRYDRAFKERAVKLSYERNSITELASELGILPDRIYSWRKEFADYGSASFSGHGIERLSDECRRVKELKKKLKTTELELEKLRKSDRRFLQNRQVMYAFIDCNRGRYTVEMIARVLHISPRSYYDHKRGRHNLREQKCKAFERLIQQVYATAKWRYGASRIAAETQAKHHFTDFVT